MRRLVAFLRRDLLIELSYPWFWLWQGLGLAGGLLVLWAAARLVGGREVPGINGEFLPWVLVGNAGALLLSVTLGAFAQRMRREQFSGTLEVLFTSRTPFAHVVLFSAAYDLLRILPQSGLFLALAWWLGPRAGGPVHAFLLVLFVASALMLFAGLGVLAAAAVLAWQRGDPVVRLLSAGTALFGTAYLPAELLPGPLAKLPALVPLTPILAGLRGCVLGTAAPVDMLAPLLTVGIEAAVLFPLGLLAFRLALNAARRRGSLASY